jgi:hypothetical protein
LLPTLSCLSVRNVPESRLRHRPSSRSLRISPLHREFRSPLPPSSQAVTCDLPGLSPGLSHRSYLTTYAPFTPSKSEQRLPPLSYRGCWHRVSRGCFWRYRPNGYPSHLPSRKGFTTRRPSSPTRRRCVRLSPIAQYSSLLPPVGVWPVSQCQCGWSSSQTSYPSQPWWAITPPTS